VKFGVFVTRACGRDFLIFMRGGWCTCVQGIICHAGSDLWSGCDENHSSDLTTFQAKILPDDILRANQFHAHPYHHLLTCLDDDDQWFWSYHLAHVIHHAGSDLLSGCDENQQ
jgi:hypothetical protein